MASEEKQTPETRKKQRKKRRYPLLSWEDALEVAEGVYKSGGRQPADRKAISEVIGSKGGRFNIRLASAVQWGLLRSVGGSMVELTDEGQQYFYPSSEDVAGVRANVLRELFFNVPLFKDLNSRYEGNPPSTKILANVLSAKPFSLPEKDGLPVAKTFLRALEQIEPSAVESDEGEEVTETPSTKPGAVGRASPHITLDTFNAIYLVGKLAGMTAGKSADVSALLTELSDATSELSSTNNLLQYVASQYGNPEVKDKEPVISAAVEPLLRSLRLELGIKVEEETAED